MPKHRKKSSIDKNSELYIASLSTRAGTSAIRQILFHFPHSTAGILNSTYLNSYLLSSEMGSYEYYGHYGDYKERLSKGQTLGTKKEKRVSYLASVKAMENCLAKEASLFLDSHDNESRSLLQIDYESNLLKDARSLLDNTEACDHSYKDYVLDVSQHQKKLTSQVIEFVSIHDNLADTFSALEHKIKNRICENPQQHLCGEMRNFLPTLSNKILDKKIEYDYPSCDSYTLYLYDKLIGRIASNQALNTKTIESELFSNKDYASKEVKLANADLLNRMMEEASIEALPIEYIFGLMLTNLTIIDQVRSYLLPSIPDNQTEKEDNQEKDAKDLMKSMRKEIIVFAQAMQIETLKRLLEILQMRRIDSYVSEIVEDFAVNFDQYLANFLCNCTKSCSEANGIAVQLMSKIQNDLPISKGEKTNLINLHTKIELIFGTIVPDLLGLKVSKELFSVDIKESTNTFKEKLIEVMKQEQKVQRSHPDQPKSKRMRDIEEADKVLTHSELQTAETKIKDAISPKQTNSLPVKSCDDIPSPPITRNIRRNKSFDNLTTELSVAHSSQDSVSSERQLDI